MAKAHQQYFSDDEYILKENTTFNLDESIIQRIDDIDARAEENVIEIVKVNWTPLIPDAQKAVDVPVPLVEDNLTSIDPTASLSARQWKILYDYIVNLQSRGRFLSNWNAATWTPVTAPFWTWYSYNPWDYYVVSVVDTVGNPPQNLRPEWTVYTWAQSQTPEPDTTLGVSDMYVFDGQQWTLLKNSARQIAIDQTLSVTSTNPVENRVITNALNTKQPLLSAWSNISIDQNTWEISAIDTTYSNEPAAQGWTADSLVTTGDKYNWDNKQDGLTPWANIQIVNNVISATDTVNWNFPAVEWWTVDSLVTTWDKYIWNNKQDRLTAWDNIQIVWSTISSTDTTYTAWAWININNNVISADDENAVWGNITWTLSNQTDLQNALDWKQNILSAWANIQIVNDTISATNSIYTAGSWISINGYNEISNEKPFIPGNIWQEWRFLKKTSNGYQWEDIWWGWGWGSSVDNTPYSPLWDWRTQFAPSQNAVYDKISAMDIVIDWKQDKLVAWDNIQIVWNTISATDTTYTAADFDIKDLADSTGLRDTWDNKQDAINDLNTIREWAALWETALQPWDNVSELINDAWYITKAVNDLTNYYTKNDTYTKTEIQNLISSIIWFEVVTTLPTTNIKTNVIYLVWPSGGPYEEYVYVDWNWVDLWTMTIDLTNYFNKTTDDSDDITEWTNHLFMTQAERTNLSHQSWTNTWDETKTSIQNKLGAASSTKSWYLTSTDWNTFNNKQNTLSAWANIQIVWNTISATDTKYTAWDWISITWTTINNIKPFNPINTWSTGEVLTKTANWYNWQPAQGWGWSYWVTSVNGRTWDVTVEEFDPKNIWSVWQVLTKISGWYNWQTIQWWWVSSVNGRTWAVTVEEFLPAVPWESGQVLKKTSNWYTWANESWWGWWGGTYYWWYWINITSNNEVINTKPFDPGSWTTGQVLKKTATWYQWADESWWGGWWVTSVNGRTWAVTVNEVSSWGTAWQVLTKTNDGYGWSTAASGDSNVKMFLLWWTTDYSTANDIVAWYNAWKLPIIKYYTNVSYYDVDWTSHSVAWYYTFYIEPYDSNQNHLHFLAIETANNGSVDNVNWYTIRQLPYIELQLNGSTVIGITTWTQRENRLDFISPWVDYTNAYMPEYDWSPATKAYVDSINWVWTLSEYNALVNQWQIDPNKVYNITSLS